MVKTYGLTHISLTVRDSERSLHFYCQVFGVKEYYRDETVIQALGPGEHDVLAFDRNRRGAGKRGGIDHFGFRLTDPADIDTPRSPRSSAPAASFCGAANSRPGLRTRTWRIPTATKSRSGTSKCGAG